MDNLTEIVNDTCPSEAVSIEALSHRTASAALEDWAQLVDVNTSPGSLQLSSGLWLPDMKTVMTS